MKLLHILPVTLLLWFVNQLVDSQITCSKDQYIVVENGTAARCLDCNLCPHGFGLFPPCGSKVDHPPPIDCVPCVAGKTYSDDYGPSSCKNCQLCSRSEIVTKNCTLSEDTVCSKTCEEGYYHENSTHDCQKCSHCCNNGNDIRIKECQSMPSNKQCSVHSTQQCKPEPATTSQVVTTYPSSTGSTTSSASVSRKPNAVIIIIPVIGVILAVIFIIVLILTYKRRKRSRNNLHISYHHGGQVEDGTRHLLHDDDCDLNHMELNVTIESPNQITEGQKISLSLSYICDNQNNNRKCNFDFEWKKDGDSIPNNNCQNYSKDLNIDNVEVADSGRYYCQVHCSEHDHKNIKSSTKEMRVHPGEGNELKLFSELDYSVQQRVINLLTPETKGIGNWMDLGREYGMEEDDLKALVDNKAAAVIGYMKSRFPELTVFDFCKVLKSAKMKQMKIVKILKKELTKPKDTAAKSEFQTVNRPDSGIGDGFDSDGPLQVNLPPETSSKPINLRNPLLNPSFADSREASRESSIEDLSGSFYENVKSTNLVDDKGYSKGVKFFRRKKSGDSQVNNDSNGEEDEEPKSDTRKKTRYGRQTSKDSQKSDIDDVGNRERRRSRSSSITSSLKGFVLKQPSVEYSPLDHHHEESDDGGLQA